MNTLKNFGCHPSDELISVGESLCACGNLNAALP